jgi:hypothetical protein
MAKENIMKTIIGTIILLLALLFVPEKTLPSYNIIGYVSIIGLISILGGLKTSIDINNNNDLGVKNLFKELSIYLTILIPLSILLYTNIVYKNKIEDKVQYVSNYSALKIVTTIIFGIQTYQVYDYIFNEGLVSTNKILGIVLMALLNTGCSLLLWSRVAFFITDGFKTIDK